MTRHRLFGVLIEADRDGAWEPVTVTAWGKAVAHAYLRLCLKASVLLAGKDACLELGSE